MVGVGDNGWVWVVAGVAGLVLATAPAGIHLFLAGRVARGHRRTWICALVPALLVGLSPVALLLGERYQGEPNWSLVTLAGGLCVAALTLPRRPGQAHVSTVGFALLVLISLVCLALLFTLGAGVTTVPAGTW